MKKIVKLLSLMLLAGSTLLANNESLLIYAGVLEDFAVETTKQFEKETGIKTQFVRMSSGETLARIKAERNNMTASVWFGGPVDAYVAANADGLLEPYISPEAANIPEKFKDSTGLWTGAYVGYLGFVGNKKLLAEIKADMPTSWADLLKPEFKGEIVTAHPGSSGTAFTMLATIVQMMGEEKGMEYMTKLNDQVKQYTKSGTAPGRMVGMGEYAVGITFLHDAIKYRKEGYEDIIITAPSEGTGFEIGGVALLKNSPNQEAAKKFIDWVLSKKGQEIGQSVGSFQFLTNSTANPPEDAKEIADSKLIDYDFDWAGKNRNDLLEKFNNATKTTPPTK
ncbi:ABC transporter substrate-binding protein [Fusobacterium sp. PH5-44]|uniref:ABC transporter substrate-binding protein n=1 Tax=unclassified Fusobacterium TaxID=2648384 RepID=UPI003D1F403D